MENKNSFIFIMFLIILVATSVSGAEILKPAQVDQDYIILQTCSSCTFVNITVSNVNGIVAPNVAMEDNGSGVWVYNLTPTLTSRYDVTGQGDKDGINTSFVTFFEVTPSGRISSTGDSILYALFSFIIFGTIAIISLIVFTMPSGNEKDERGFETKILKIKYIRVLFIFLLWPLTILLLNFLTALSVNYSALASFSGILGFLFQTMLSLSWPFTVIVILWIVIMLVHDTNIGKLLKRLDRFNVENP